MNKISAGTRGKKVSHWEHFFMGEKNYLEILEKHSILIFQLYHNERYWRLRRLKIQWSNGEKIIKNRLIITTGDKALD